MNLIYFYPKDGGGAPVTVARNLLDELTKNRDKIPFELKILCPLSYENRLKETYPGVEIITIKNILKHLNAAVVHLPTSPLVYPNLKFLLHILTKVKRKTLIANWHSEPRIEMEYNFHLIYLPDLIFAPITFRSVDVNIVNSYMMKGLIESRYTVKEIEVIPNGIYNEWFNNETGYVDLGEYSIFYHGRFDKIKGLQILIPAVKKLIKKYPSIKLYLAGYGPYETELNILVRKLNLTGNVIFLGRLTCEEIKKYLNSCNMAIYPSLHDNFPLAYIEAFASASCPVIYSIKSGIHDFVTKKGYAFMNIDPTIENIQRSIEKILSNNHDSDLVFNQKQFASEFTWGNVVGYYIEVYNKIWNGYQNGLDYGR